MPNTLQLTNTLADETRYSIYQYIVKGSKEVTVQEIAHEFSIHPNVARLHLSKLNESKLLHSELVKNGKGGRPARIYRTAESPVYLSFPKQENHLLLQWLIELAVSFGQEALTKGTEIAYNYGKQQMKQSAPSVTSFEEKINILTASANAIGYVPSMKDRDNKKIITFSIYNCPYKDFMNNHSEFICKMHEAYLKGQFDSLFPTNEFVQIESMQNNCSNCVYHIEVL